MACRWVRSWKLLLSWTRMTTWCCHSPSAQGLLVLRPPQISISRPSGASMLARSCRPRLWPFPATAQVLSTLFSNGHIVFWKAVLVLQPDVPLMIGAMLAHGLDAAKYSNCCISPRQASTLPHRVFMSLIICSHRRISRGSSLASRSMLMFAQEVLDAQGLNVGARI